jgi:hypothetical protein
MAARDNPDIEDLLARIEDLEDAVAELRDGLDEVTANRVANPTLMSGLVVYYPDDDHGHVLTVSATSRRLPLYSIPPRPTVREWAGILQHTSQWPVDATQERTENLLLRVIDPHLNDLPIDLLDAATIERAVTKARLTDDERATARQLLEFAVTTAAASDKAPAI